MKEWKFSDPKNVAVFTTRSVVKDQKPILTVFHNEKDGYWEFHHEREPKKENAILVGLFEIVEIDETINELFDLPLGWLAWREDVGKPWHRKKYQERAA